MSTSTGHNIQVFSVNHLIDMYHSLYHSTSIRNKANTQSSGQPDTQRSHHRICRLATSNSSLQQQSEENKPIGDDVALSVFHQRHPTQPKLAQPIRLVLREAWLAVVAALAAVTP
ncbi:hypothetical protein HaLaN_31801, partial [Haematococcus lacustris]